MPTWSWTNPPAVHTLRLNLHSRIRSELSLAADPLSSLLTNSFAVCSNQTTTEMDVRGSTHQLLHIHISRPQRASHSNYFLISPCFSSGLVRPEGGTSGSVVNRRWQEASSLSRLSDYNHAVHTAGLLCWFVQMPQKKQSAAMFSFLSVIMKNPVSVLRYVVWTKLLWLSLWCLIMIEISFYLFIIITTVWKTT